jgi:hypothetical protein
MGIIHYEFEPFIPQRKTAASNNVNFSTCPALKMVKPAYMNYAGFLADKIT